jgi:DNA-binding transcriptional LysR family regulator
MANSADGFTPALIAGFGPAAQPESIVWRELLDGALVEVMPDWRMATIDLSWMTPTGSVRRTRVTAFLDVLARWFSTAPWARTDSGGGN